MMRICLTRLGPVVASALAHVGIVGAIALTPAMTVRTPVLFVELADPEPPPPPSPVRSAPVDRRPLRLPKLIEKPIPTPPPVSRREPEPPTPEPPPPPAATQPPPTPVTSPPLAPTPAAPAPPASAASASPAPSAVASRAAADGIEPGPGLFPNTPAVAPPASGSTSSSGAPQPTGPAVAGLPGEGITQRAIPQGGYQHRPAYPSTARRLGVQGTTLLNVLVADDGRVANVVVARSAGHPDLDEAAAAAVRRWRFEPARRGAEKVAMWVQLPVEFRLR
jgi:periplasmic protein TonB